MIILIAMLRWAFDFIQPTPCDGDGHAVSGCWLKLSLL